MKNKESIVVIDFDLTIANSDFPDTGEIFPKAKKVINQLFKNNTIIINTCRSGKYEGMAEDFLNSNGVKFDWINCNVPRLINFFGQDCRKISGTVYIDDKQLGGLPYTIDADVDWIEIYKILNRDHNIK